MDAQPKTLIFHHTGCLIAQCTGRLQCVNIEIGRVDFYGHGASLVRVRTRTYAHSI